MASHEGMHDSPPPMIVQLRERLAAVILCPEVLLDPLRVQLFLDQCVEMCDAIMNQHPDLVRDYFEVEARKWQ